MTNDEGKALLESLRGVRWEIAGGTYGNNHSTLIGLLVQWWLEGHSDSRTVLEGAPGVHYEVQENVPDTDPAQYQQKKVRSHADAMLCENRMARGIVEVEGTRYVETATKIGKYFAAHESVDFAILLVYSTGAKGKGEQRSYSLEDRKDVFNELVMEITEVTSDNKGKAILLLTLEKQLLPKEEWMFKNSYYSGKTTHLKGQLYLNGKAVESAVHFGAKANS